MTVPEEIPPVHCPRLPIVVALGVGIVLATMGGLARRDEASGPAFSRAADGDQRTTVAKPEVRDAAEEQVEQEEGTDPTHGPALATVDGPRPAPAVTFARDTAPHLDAGRLLGRARSIRGPPRRA